MSKLTPTQRSNLSNSTFAIPSERKYPINDKNHARAAIMLINKGGLTTEQKQTVMKKALAKLRG